MLRFYWKSKFLLYLIKMPPKKSTTVKKPKTLKKKVRKVANVVPNYLNEWEKKAKLKQISKSLEILKYLDITLDEETKSSIGDLMKKMISGKVLNEDKPTREMYFYDEEEENDDEEKNE